jgi:hypothetical protein
MTWYRYLQFNFVLDIKNQKGNFKALLEFCINNGDQILKEHFKSATKNTIYISKTMQNDLIDCCRNVISDKIIHKVHISKIYSI